MNHLFGSLPGVFSGVSLAALAFASGVAAGAEADVAAELTHPDRPADNSI